MSNRCNSRGVRKMSRRNSMRKSESKKRFAAATSTLMLSLLVNESSGSSPTKEPTHVPSTSPSYSPTKALYYPDWSNDGQRCVNDNNMPDYMLTLKGANFLFEDKEECCLLHFPWRVRQCMGSNDPVYYRDGSSATCAKGGAQDDYHVAFDTLEECCKEQVFWDEYGCIQNSVKVIEFKYTIDLPGIVLPTNCQDAHLMAIRIQDATASAMPSDTTISVVGFAGLTIENDVASGTIKCGGQTVEGNQFILVLAFVECSSSSCTDDASVQALFDSTFQSLLNYAKGSMTQDIVNATGESPIVPQLEQIAVDGDTMGLVENFKDPRTDEDPLIYATSLTVEGELSVTGFDSSSFDAAQKALAISFFQAALKTTLESEGFFYLTKVTSMVDGKITYEIFITADSPSDAVAEASSIETSLAADATRDATVSNAYSEASGSSIESAFNSGYQIDVNTVTATTEIPVAKVTIEGKLGYAYSPYRVQDDALNDTHDPLIEKAMYEVLVGRGIIDEGSKVKVTSRDSDAKSVTLDIILYADVASDIQAKADSIISEEDFFGCDSNNCVKDEVATKVKASLHRRTRFSIFAMHHESTTGVPSRGWWPNWVFGDDTCKNGGKVPAYMNRNYGIYFSDSKRDCCEQWFPYDVKGCVGPTTGGSTTVFFVPNWVDFNCAKKLEKEMDDWELNDTFGSLEECCEKRFSYVYTSCCSAAGLGGCSSTETLYFPQDGKCVEGIKGEMEEWQISFAEKSVRKCCTSNFYWLSERNCCENSGGC